LRGDRRVKGQVPGIFFVAGVRHTDRLLTVDTDRLLTVDTQTDYLL